MARGCLATLHMHPLRKRRVLRASQGSPGALRGHNYGIHKNWDFSGFFWGPLGPILGPQIASPGPGGPGTGRKYMWRGLASRSSQTDQTAPVSGPFLVFYASKKCPQKVPQKALIGQAGATPRCPKVARRSWQGPRKDPERSSDGCKNLQPRSLWVTLGDQAPWGPP